MVNKFSHKTCNALTLLHVHVPILNNLAGKKRGVLQGALEKIIPATSVNNTVFLNGLAYSLG